MQVYVRKYVCMRVGVYVYAGMCTQVCVYVYRYVYACVCMQVCI